MKNILVLAISMSIAASPAFASRARLESLGEGKNGSYYINDSRNIFLNPAQIVKYKKKMFLELGTEPTAAATGAGSANGLVDNALGSTNTRGQGGFTNTFGDFTYGLYFNQTTGRALEIVNAANAGLGVATGFAGPDSQLEAFFAGEGGLNWGISLFHAGNNVRNAAVYTDGFERTASLFGTRVGIDMNNFQIFASVGIKTNSTIKNTATDEIKGKIGVDGGVTYTMDNMTVFGKVILTGADVEIGAANTKTELRNQQYGVGLGWKNDMTKSTTMYARLEGDYAKQGTSAAPTTTWNVPVVVAAETQALSWLAVRGSVQHSLAGQQMAAAGVRNNLGGSTTIAAGLGLTFGDLTIDGLLSTSTTGATANPFQNVAGFGTAPKSSANWGLGDNMLSRVALTYNF